MSFPCLPPSNLLLFPPILRIQPEANSQGSLRNVVCRFLVLSDKEMSYEGWEWRSQAIEQPWLVILLLINAFPQASFYLFLKEVQEYVSRWRELNKSIPCFSTSIWFLCSDSAVRVCINSDSEGYLCFLVTSLY